MIAKTWTQKTAIWLCLAAFAVLPAISAVAATNYWDVVPEDEVPSPNYDSILYSEVGPALHEIEMQSNRLKVEVIGKSAGGRDLFLATVAKNGNRDRFEYFKLIRELDSDPDAVLDKIDSSSDFKVAAFVNGSIHGDEYEGVDACMRLIRTLALENTDEVNTILDNMIVVFNVVCNPDGRVLGTRRNASGIDVNRDMITQSQPEARAFVSIVTKWNPLITLDLHDDFQPMLIEPCSPPHNPNYEYDLYIEWAFRQAEAMEAELLAQTGFDALIPYRDWDPAAQGYTWDDWPPIYGAMYPMYHGSYGHTLETPYEDERGVDADYAAVWGALKFVAQNKVPMFQDQINIFRRGVRELPQQPISDDMLAVTTWEQYNDLTLMTFPAAYVIPAGGALQVSEHQASRLVDFLIFNGVEVEKSSEAFTMKNVAYPAGTYVVWMNQAKRALANTILDEGWDVSYIFGDLDFYSPPASWSHPLLWGASCVEMTDRIQVATEMIKKATAPTGSVESGGAGAYAYAPDTLAAIRATNALLKQGVAVYRMESAFSDSGRYFRAGTFIIQNGTVASELADNYALDISSIGGVPENATTLVNRKIAVAGESGLTVALDSMGFAYDEIWMDELQSDAIMGYDLFINNSVLWEAAAGWQEDFSLTDAGRAQMTQYFASGRDYVGILWEGVSLAVDSGQVNAPYAEEGGMGTIIRVVFQQNDSVAAGFPENWYAFMNDSVYFTSVPDNVVVSASIYSQSDYVVSGLWFDWKTSGANGSPLIIRSKTGNQDITLIGIDPTFRGHPENTFRIVANAIFDGLD